MDGSMRDFSSSKKAGRILEIYDRYHRPEFIGIDPLVTIRQFTDPGELELAALVAAVLSYGRVEIVIRNIRALFERMESQPFRFIRDTDLANKIRILQGFRHRFNSGADLALFLHSLRGVLDSFGSIESCFAKGLRPGNSPMKGAITFFSDTVKKVAEAIGGGPPSKSFSFLVPSPAGGGACKRFNMYLRWMIRPDDGIDRGVWHRLKPAQLIMPLDTHVAGIARRLGISRRKTADWRMAEEVTAFLRGIDPLDPVRFDFSLCRDGMVLYRKDAA